MAADQYLVVRTQPIDGHLVTTASEPMSRDEALTVFDAQRGIHEAASRGTGHRLRVMRAADFVPPVPASPEAAEALRLARHRRWFGRSR